MHMFIDLENIDPLMYDKKYIPSIHMFHHLAIKTNDSIFFREIKNRPSNENT